MIVGFLLLKIISIQLTMSATNSNGVWGKEKNMEKIKVMILSLLMIILTACDDTELIDEIKYDLSIEYDVDISEIDVKTIEYGVSVFSTNQFEVHIESKDIHMYLIAKEDTYNNFRRLPIED